MRKILILLVLLILVSSVSASTLLTTYNPFVGKLDYYMFYNTSDFSNFSSSDINNTIRVHGGEFFVNRSLWTSIDSYPAGCAAGEFVSGINDTLTCSAPAGGGAWNISGSDWLVNESGVLDWNESRGNSTYINADEAVNSSNYWDALDNVTLPWLYSTGGNLAWNETKGDADYVDVAGDTLTGALGFNDDVQLQLGSSDDFVCEYDTGQTPDAFWCGLGADSNLWIISEKADTGDRAIPLQANPTLAVGSASGTALNFTTLSHDGVDAILDNLNGGNISLIDDTRVGGNLYVGDSLGSASFNLYDNGTSIIIESLDSTKALDLLTYSPNGTAYLCYVNNSGSWGCDLR